MPEKENDERRPDGVSALFPGTKVEILDGKATVFVYPVGLRHLREYGSRIASLLHHFIDSSRISVDVLGTPEGKRKLATAIMSQLAPYLLEHSLDLVEKCIRVKDEVCEVGEIPHWDWPPIVEAWIEESFGDEKKWRPWLEMVERTVSRATGEPFSILETWSASSSDLVTASTTS